MGNGREDTLTLNGLLVIGVQYVGWLKRSVPKEVVSHRLEGASEGEGRGK